MVLLLLIGCSSTPIFSSITAEEADIAFEKALSYQYGFDGTEISPENAVKWYERSILAGDIEHLNCYAYFLATTTHEKYRDGDKAYRLMEKVMGADKVQFYHKDTFAAVLAELGQYKKAVQVQSAAIDEMPDDVDSDRRRSYIMRHHFYKTEQAWRE